MNKLTNEERELLKWVLQAVRSQESVQPLESLADVCESVDFGLAPDGLERPYYGMSYKHQLMFLAEYVKAMEEQKMDYVKSIEAWAIRRGLDKTNPDKQLIKLAEEVGELAEAHNKEWQDRQIDSLGDIFVVLTIYALQNDLRIDDCIKEAYNTIKDRNGKMVDGVFFKDSDLKEVD